MPDPAPPQPILEIRNLAKKYGPVVALSSVDVTVRPGEYHAIMGSNGAGKSTLVKILTGVLRPDGGTITLRGEARVMRSPAEAQKAGLSSVYQESSLVPDLTIAQNMRLTATPLDRMQGWLEELGTRGLDHRILARDLPLATLRILDLARALATEPTILILDEMTAALPADLTEAVFGVLERWRSADRSLIFISHRLADVSAICDRVTVLRDGFTAGVIDPARGNESTIVEHMLGDTFRPGTAFVGTTTLPDHSKEIPVLEAQSLQIGLTLRDVSLTVNAGEVVGVAALEGQGQQELFDCLAGVRRPEGGTILVEGSPRSFRDPQDAIRHGVVLVPADRAAALLRLRSVRENVALPDVNRPRRWGLIDIRAEKEKVKRVIGQLEIDVRAQSEVRRLSGGNQQKVTIARWLASGFKALLCFDPTRGIDIGAKRQIYALVRELAADGAAVLLFTSELSEIQLACDRVIVIFGGQVVGEMPAGDADEATLLRAAHGLTEARASAITEEIS